ncbi:MAG TPA: type I-B CRISPR-associated endonuclease Cas1b [Ignavibacteriaceae bacterium]|nr:type I-B CRISPR-associated endonuclease Cas1b [Ignavibacteriaceae bacterium]
MKRNYYIFSAGRLIRKDHTLYFEPLTETPADEPNLDPDSLEIDDPSLVNDESSSPETLPPLKMPRKPLPVEDIEAIYCFGEIRFNSRFLNYISQKQITLHLFNYYGFYSGSFYPREPFVSGKLLLSQVNYYNNPIMRIELAQQFVKGSADNILKNLQYYNTRDKDTTPFIEQIESLIKKIPGTAEIDELMGIEGNIRSIYYESWNLVIKEPIDFTKRIKRPPPNPVNALISFGNSLVYTTVLSEIYKTQLNPLISFLHEPGERRFSLSLDIAEIFKPLLADRIIFTLLNKKQIQEKHFTKQLNFCHLNDEGRKIFTREFDEKLKTTIQHRQLKKSVSYRHLIRLECYKIIKHILNEKKYTPFKIWW